MKRLLYSILFSLVVCNINAQHTDSLMKGAASIPVNGLVDSSFSVTLDEINSYPVKEGKNFNITGPDGKIKRTIQSFKGILLKDLLAKAKIRMPKEKDRGTYIILISATDGYKVIFSYNEIMYGPAGSSTYLIYEEDGKPIEKNGPFIVICTSDIATAPRHVKWVKEITVKKIDD